MIDFNDNVWVFGRNSNGQLGLGDRSRSTPTQVPNIKARQVSAGTLHTIVVDLENNVWVFGHNSYGHLGLGDHDDRSGPTQVPNIKAGQVSAGEQHTVVVGTKMI